MPKLTIRLLVKLSDLVFFWDYTSRRMNLRVGRDSDGDLCHSCGSVSQINFCRRFRNSLDNLETESDGPTGTLRRILVAKHTRLTMFRHKRAGKL